MLRQLLLSFFCFSALPTSLTHFASLAFAEGTTGCDRVVFDCIAKPHRMRIEGAGMPLSSGKEMLIDCGKNTDKSGATTSVTYPGKGNVGSMLSTTGNAVTHGLDITGINGMGTCGGTSSGDGAVHASIIHTIPSGANPSGANTSQGCIHVSESAFELLSKHCVQAPLEIQTPAKKAPPAPAQCSGSSGAGGSQEGGVDGQVQ